MIYFKTKNECPYKFVCTRSNCNNLCVFLHELNLIFESARIPKRYAKPFKLYPGDKDIDNFNDLRYIKENINNFIYEGRNLLLTSCIKGNGKTSWGIKLLQSYIHENLNKSGFRDNCIYLDTSEYLRELKLSFDSNTENYDLISDKKLLNIDFVVWDNIDENKLTEWERNFLSRLIRIRISNQKSNVFITSNQDSNLTLKVGENISYYLNSSDTFIKLFSERGAIK